MAAARGRSVEPEWVDPQHLARLAGFDGHQGVLLEVGERRWAIFLGMVPRDCVNCGNRAGRCAAAGTEDYTHPVSQAARQA